MNKKAVIILFLLIGIIFSGCNFIIYDPVTGNGTTMDVKVIKGVVSWYFYYYNEENLDGCTSVLYPYSPYYTKIRDSLTELFYTYDNMSWEYEIEDVSLKSNGTALVTCNYHHSAPFGEETGKLYMDMKKSTENIWYIYNITGVSFMEGSNEK